MKNFFSTIIYSAANEDPSSELAALKLTPNDTVLTITGSGARALDLLIANPKKVISIDMNDKQNFLLSLKCSAYKNLSYPEFQQFLGITTYDDRLSIYQKLRSDLNERTKNYWDQEADKIKSGILYCGVWETYLLKLSCLTRFRTKVVKQLFDAETIEQQKTIFDKKWNGFFWKQFIKLLNIRWIWKVLLKEPGIDLIDPNLHIGRYLHERLAHVISHQKAKNNPFLNLIIFGKYTEDCLPLHLQERHFSMIKERLDILEIVTMPIDSYLNRNKNAIDAFSISDFSSYANQTQYQSIWRSIMFAAKDSARICERFFLVNYFPENIDGVNIVRDKTLENKLFHEDHSFIYSFNCATIKHLHS